MALLDYFFRCVAESRKRGISDGLGSYPELSQARESSARRDTTKEPLYVFVYYCSTQPCNCFCLFHWTRQQQSHIDASFQQCQVDRAQLQRKNVFLLFTTYRGRGKKKERRIGVDLTSCTGKTERRKKSFRGECRRN